MARLLVGTSGWQFYDVENVFYPRTLHSRDYLRFYAERKSTVEINSTFYRFSRPSTFAKWYDETPDGFVFAVKANRTFTHETPLEDREGRLPEMLEAMGALKEKLGPILFQFPPSFGRDLRALKKFLPKLPRGPRYVFELRHASWHVPEITRALAEHDVAYCAYDMKQKRVVPKPRASFAYVRLHGPLSLPYRGAYPEEQLAAWARHVRCWRTKGLDTFVYFDNTMRGDAIADAARFQRLVEGHAAPDPLNTNY